MRSDAAGAIVVGDRNPADDRLRRRMRVCAPRIAAQMRTSRVRPRTPGASTRRGGRDYDTVRFLATILAKFHNVRPA